jgi:hypothetical protein
MTALLSNPTARIEAILKRLGEQYEPPLGWEARVLATTCPQRRWRLWFPMAALGAVILLCWIRLRGAVVAKPPNHDLVIDIQPEPGGPRMRGTSAHVGDRIHITATSSDRYRAIWVYHNDRELVVACQAGSPCHGTRDTMTADVTLQAIGSYIFLAVASPSPLPAPQGSFDPDLASAERAGAKTEIYRLEVH